MDKIDVKIEIIDTFSDGNTEITELRKNMSICDGVGETQLDTIIDIFVDFMVAYGFQKETISKGLGEWVDDYENMV